jgi:hypothetical protein
VPCPGPARTDRTCVPKQRGLGSGAGRRPPADTYRTADRPDETHQESLQHAGFEQLEEHEFNAPHTWTVDTFIGYLYSTAASSKAVFGDTLEAFEADHDLKRTLLALEPSGQLHETISFHYVLARRCQRRPNRASLTAVS